MILQAYVDESGSRNQDACLVLAGFISPAEEWAAFSDEWQASLDAEPSIRYFKMREAANTPSGEFKNWKRDEVRAKVREFVQIIKHHAKIAIHCTMPIALFDGIIGREMLGAFTNPYIHTLYAIAAGIGLEAIDQKSERVEIIFDEQDKYALLVKNIYPRIKQKLDPELCRILPAEPMFKKDVDFLPLQASDLLAWLIRRAWNGHRTEWEWIANELMPVIPMSEYSSIYTADRLKNVREMADAVQFTDEELREMRRVWELTVKR